MVMWIFLELAKGVVDGRFIRNRGVVEPVALIGVTLAIFIDIDMSSPEAMFVNMYDCVINVVGHHKHKVFAFFIT